MEFVTLATKYGWSVAFAAAYFGTVALFIKTILKDRATIIKDKQEERERAVRIAQIIKQATIMNEGLILGMKELRKAVYEDINVHEKFIAYMKGRDDHRGGS